MGKRSKTTEALLWALEKAIDTGIILYDYAENTHHYVYGSPNLERYELYHIVGRLKQKGWVETIKNEGKVIVNLTSKGQNQLAIERALKSDKWDGKFRVVIFDIPEKNRKVRDILRWRLKAWGFKYLQKSLWVSKKDIAQPMREFIQELGIEKWVHVLVCTDIDSVRIFDDR